MDASIASGASVAQSRALRLLGRVFAAAFGGVKWFLVTWYRGNEEIEKRCEEHHVLRYY